MVRYRVEYQADGWQAPSPTRKSIAEWQVVSHDLGDGLRLYVVLDRWPWHTLRVTAARIETAYTDPWGRQRYKAVKVLSIRQLELVEVRASPPR